MESIRRDVQLPFGDDTDRELRRRALTPLEPPDPGARQPALPHLLVAGDSRQLLKHRDPAQLDQDTSEIEKNELDVTTSHDQKCSA
jgi:hypothetical protein